MSDDALADLRSDYHDDCHCPGCRGIAAYDSLRAESEVLRKALKRYGFHVGHCPKNLLQTESDWHQACSCGFEMALAGATEAVAASPTSEGT